MSARKRIAAVLLVLAVFSVEASAGDDDSVRTGQLVIRAGPLSFSDFGWDYTTSFRVSGRERYSEKGYPDPLPGGWGWQFSSEYFVTAHIAFGLSLFSKGYFIGDESELGDHVFIPYDVFEWKKKLKTIGVFATATYLPRLGKAASLRLSAGLGPYFVHESYSVRQLGGAATEHVPPIPANLAKYFLIGIDIAKAGSPASFGVFVQYLFVSIRGSSEFVAPVHIIPYSLPAYDAEIVFHSRPRSYDDVQFGFQFAYRIGL
jgi:hypothetical protein